MKKFNEENLMKAANNGDVNAMVDLGYMYNFIKLDFEKAEYWYQKALEQGEQEALLFIARLYEQKDIQKAAKYTTSEDLEVEYTLSEETIEWYEKALKFLDKNYKEHVEYAVLAAELLSGEDAFRIDLEKAYEYFKYAASQEDDEELEKTWIEIARKKVKEFNEK